MPARLCKDYNIMIKLATFEELLKFGGYSALEAAKEAGVIINGYTVEKNEAVIYHVRIPLINYVK